MFGLENKKKPSPKKKELFFDLELTLKDSKKKQELITYLESRVQKIQSLMRSGENKEEFNKYNILLQGYQSAIKVVNRVKINKDHSTTETSVLPEKTGQDNEELFTEDFSLLIELGFIGAKQLDEIGATRIFQAAQMISPTSVAPQIGLGHIALSKLEIKKATEIFQKVTQQEPSNELAQCFLGVCFLLSKDRDKLKKGEKNLKEILETTEDETVKNLATLCLEWSKNDLSKKVAAPFSAT